MSFTLEKLGQSEYKITIEDCKSLFDYAKILYEMQNYVCKYCYNLIPFFRGGKVPLQLKRNSWCIPELKLKTCCLSLLGLACLRNPEPEVSWKHWENHDQKAQRHYKEQIQRVTNANASPDSMAIALGFNLQFYCWTQQWFVCSNASRHPKLWRSLLERDSLEKSALDATYGFCLLAWQKSIPALAITTIELNEECPNFITQ